MFSFPCPWTYKFPIFAFFSRPVPHHVERTLHSRKGHHPVDSTQWGLLLCCAVFRWVFQHRLQVIFILFCFILFCLMQKKDGYFCPCGSVCRKKNVQVVPSCVQCEVSHPCISNLDTFYLNLKTVLLSSYVLWSIVCMGINGAVFVCVFFHSWHKCQFSCCSLS